MKASARALPHSPLSSDLESSFLGCEMFDASSTPNGLFVMGLLGRKPLSSPRELPGGGWALLHCCWWIKPRRLGISKVFHSCTGSLGVTVASLLSELACYLQDLKYSTGIWKEALVFNRGLVRAPLLRNSTSGLLTGSDLFMRLIMLSGSSKPCSHTSKNSWFIVVSLHAL